MFAYGGVCVCVVFLYMVFTREPLRFTRVFCVIADISE